MPYPIHISTILYSFSFPYKSRIDGNRERERERYGYRITYIQNNCKRKRPIRVSFVRQFFPCTIGCVRLVGCCCCCCISFFSRCTCCINIYIYTSASEMSLSLFYSPLSHLGFILHSKRKKDLKNKNLYMNKINNV